MGILRDQRGLWLNEWAEKHVRERPGEPFTKDDDEFWDKFIGWLSDLSEWFVKSNHLSIDPVELTERTRDKVLRYSHTFRGKGTLTNWVFTTARNTLRTMLKEQKDTTSIDDESVKLTPVGLIVPHPAEMEMLVESNKELVHRLLAQLPNKRDAEIVDLIRIQGRSDVAVGERYGIEPSTVRAIVCRALAFLSSTNRPRKDVAQQKPGLERKQARGAGS